MKGISFLCAALLASTSLAATAQTLKTAPATAAADAELKKVWGGGDPKGSVYSSAYVPRVIEVMAANRLEGYTWSGPSEGTLMNAEKVTMHPTHLAVGQADILRQLNGQDIPGKPGKKFRFSVLHDNIGPECLYVVTKEKTYTTLGHIMANNFDLTVLTGGEKSGSFGTWRILQSEFEELKGIPVEHVGGADKIVEAIQAKPASFGFFVMRPDPNSDVFKAIAKAKLTLVPVIDDKLASTYEFLELKVAAGSWYSSGGGTFHTTACTSVALITGDPEAAQGADARTIARIKATNSRLKEVRAHEFRPSLAGWKDMFDSLKVSSKEKAQQLAAQSKKALEEALKK